MQQHQPLAYWESMFSVLRGNSSGPAQAHHIRLESLFTPSYAATHSAATNSTASHRIRARFYRQQRKLGTSTVGAPNRSGPGYVLDSEVPQLCGIAQKQSDLIHNNIVGLSRLMSDE